MGERDGGEVRERDGGELRERDGGEAEGSMRHRRRYLGMSRRVRGHGPHHLAHLFMHSAHDRGYRGQHGWVRVRVRLRVTCFDVGAPREGGMSDWNEGLAMCFKGGLGGVITSTWREEQPRRPRRMFAAACGSST